MLKNMFMFCAMSFFLISWLSAQENSLYEMPEYPELRIESVYKFEGDKHGYFKREHKFELVNLTNNATVRAMFVQYPPTPLFIAYIEQVESGVPLELLLPSFRLCPPASLR